MRKTTLDTIPKFNNTEHLNLKHHSSTPDYPFPEFRHDIYDDHVTRNIEGSHVPKMENIPKVQAEFHPIKQYNYAYPELISTVGTSTLHKPWNPNYTTRTADEVIAQMSKNSTKWSMHTANEVFGKGVGPMSYTIDINNTFFLRAAKRVDDAWDATTVTKTIKNSTAFQGKAKPIVDTRKYITSYGTNKHTTQVNLSDMIEFTPSTPKKPSLDAVQEQKYVVNTPTPDLGARPTDTGRPPMLLPACTACGHQHPSTVQLKWMSRVWAALDGFLTPAECDSLQALASDIAPAKISTQIEGFVDPNLRTSDIGWINGNADSGWLFRRLWEAIGEANNQMFHYDIQFLEPLQYTIYRAEQQGFYDKHYDWGAGDSGMRKLSFSIQLSDDVEYSGGDVVLYTGDKGGISIPRTKGTITVFPSWMMHEVTPVTQGVRKSLVGWFQGPVHF